MHESLCARYFYDFKTARTLYYLPQQQELRASTSHIPTLKSRSSGVGTIKWSEVKHLKNKY